MQFTLSSSNAPNSDLLFELKRISKYFQKSVAERKTTTLEHILQAVTPTPSFEE